MLSVDERVVSMLFALPFTFFCGEREVSAAYIYAVSTVPACRGRGYMKLLLQRVEALLRESGVALVFLLPASEGLRRYYAALGYENCSAMMVERLAVSSAGVAGEFLFGECDDVELLWSFCTGMQKRRAPAILHTRASIAMNVYNCRSQGGGVFTLFKDGAIEAAAFVLKRGADVFVLEHYSLSPASATALLQCLCRHFGVGELAVCHSGRGDAFCMMRVLSPFCSEGVENVEVSLLLDK